MARRGVGVYSWERRNKAGGGGGWRGVEVGGSPGTTTGRINVSQASLIETLFYR